MKVTRIRVTSTPKIEAMKGVLATLFAAQRTLKALAPEFKWAGLGNLLGDYGEFIATEVYGFTKAPSGSGGFDAITAEGKTVQVKANFAASQIGFRGVADLLLCLKIDSAGDWTEIYFGPFDAMKAVARFSARDNKHMVPISTLIKIKAGGYTIVGAVVAESALPAMAIIEVGSED